MASREHQDSHDTNVSVKSTINFNGPIIILGGAILLVFLLVGVFVFASYVGTHWNSFTQSVAPTIVIGLVWLLGIVAFALAGHAVLRLVGHTSIDLILKLLHGIAELQHKRTLANVAHIHEDHTVLLMRDGSYRVVGTKVVEQDTPKEDEKQQAALPAPQIPTGRQLLLSGKVVQSLAQGYYLLGPATMGRGRRSHARNCSVRSLQEYPVSVKPQPYFGY